MTAQLARVVKRSNWYLLPRAASAFSAFYARLDGYLSRQSATATSATGSKQCLMADSAALLASGRCSSLTSAPTQIGFWFYVIKDALEINVARTLALIATHGDVYQRVLGEVDAVQTPDAKAIDGLRYLEGCLREELRLWTPVPILLRRVVHAFKLPGGVAVGDAEKILIHAGFYHRDIEFFGESANEFSPAQAPHDALPRVYSFSGGHQSCAGQFVARFLIKATLALLLKRLRFELLGPGIAGAGVPYLYDHFKIRFRVSVRT